LYGYTDYTEKPGPETDLTSLRVEKAVLSKRTKELEKDIHKRDSEIQNLQSLLGEQVVSNIPNPAIRLIYLEEYSRTLEQVIILASMSLKVAPYREISDEFKCGIQ
jgi:nucleotidyltransferase/DNA polymerase involved in DNA repair